MDMISKSNLLFYKNTARLFDIIVFQVVQEKEDLR